MESESLKEHNNRHELHQKMLAEHKERKAIARERHRAGWHRVKILATTLK